MVILNSVIIIRNLVCVKFHHSNTEENRFLRYQNLVSGLITKCVLLFYKPSSCLRQISMILHKPKMSTCAMMQTQTIHSGGISQSMSRKMSLEKRKTCPTFLVKWWKCTMIQNGGLKCKSICLIKERKEREISKQSWKRRRRNPQVMQMPKRSTIWEETILRGLKPWRLFYWKFLI